MGIISDIPRLILEQGNAIAQGQRDVGRIWGGTLAQLGQLPGQVLEQTMALKRQQLLQQQQQLQAQVTQQHLQAGAIDLADKQRANQSRLALESVLKDPANYHADGTANNQAISQALQQRDVGAWEHWQSISSKMAGDALKLRESLSTIGKTDAETEKITQDTADKRSNYIGRLAFTGQQFLEQHPDNPLQARDDFAARVARGAVDGAIPEGRAHELIMGAASASPQQLHDFYGQFVPPDMRAKLQKEAADTEEAQARAAKLRAEAAGGGKPRALQQAQIVLPGQSGVKLGSYDPDTGQYFYGGQDVTAVGQHYVAPTAASTAAALEPLTPEAIQMTAAQYRLLGPRGMPTRLSETVRRQVINEAANQAKSIGDTPASVVTRQMMLKGDSAALTNIQKMASSADAFETKALAQADLVDDLSKRVPRTQWPVINQAIQTGRVKLLGDTDAAKLAQAIDSFTTEYAKILEGSTGSVAASKERSNQMAERMLNPAMNQGTLPAITKQMRWEMRQTLIGYDAAKQHITDRMSGTTTPPPPPTDGTTAAPKKNPFR